PYATTFRTLWNAWLRTKYKNTDGLKKVWNVGSKPLGAEMLANGDFAKPIDAPWQLERDAQCKAAWAVHKGGPDGKPFLRVTVDKMGQASWIPQFQQGGLAFEKGRVYTLAFRVRATRTCKLHMNAMMAHEPWKQFGFYSNVDIGPTWQTVRRTFVPNATDDNSRITFTHLEAGTVYELADVSLRPGGIVGLEPGQALEDDSVPVVRKGEMNVTEAARRDWIDFMWQTERDYWWGLRDFVKKDLACRSLVAGTQLSYSPAHVQAGLDYIDAHSYWKHPHFPGRPWDSRNWWVENTALVNSPGGTLAGLAIRRVADMAYTVSEYNHPAPNQYAAEGFPMLAAFGAFQKWDGLFPFAYCHNERFEPRKSDSYFDVKADTPKIAHMIACAALFLRGDAAPARQAHFAHVPLDAERKKLYETLSARSITAQHFGLDPRLSLLHQIGMNIADKAKPSGPAQPIPDDQKVFVSDTGQLRWDVSEKDAGTFTADTPRTKLFTGFVRGRTFVLGDVSLEIGKTALDWATVSMVCLDGKDFASPGRILITATGTYHNQGVELASRGGNRVWYDKGWGTEPVMCEGIPAAIALPAAAGKVTLYPLDESGNRQAAVPVAERDGKALLHLDAKHKTVWYEAVIK
ncbi:carbohydrate binding domain-containing protein, partial [bacterium]|nr:carbohydrate binding domain-containing protein [bacterium]